MKKLLKGISVVCAAFAVALTEAAYDAPAGPIHKRRDSIPITRCVNAEKVPRLQPRNNNRLAAFEYYNMLPGVAGTPDCR